MPKLITPPHPSFIRRAYDFVLIFIAAVCMAVGLKITVASPAKLTWSPPVLSNPATITLGTGSTHNVLEPAKDYIIKLPNSKKTGSTFLEGGRNIIIMGGHITIPPTDPVAQTDTDRRAIYIKNNNGTVHIEGVLIDGSGGGEMDAIAISSPQSIVQIQNVRATGLRGTDSTMHADIVQPWGGVKELRIDRLTGESSYQGLFIPLDLGPIGKAVISNVNLTATGATAYGGGGGGYMLTVSKNACSQYPITLSNIYVVPRSGRPLNKTVWPDVSYTQPCAVAGDSNEAYWPALNLVTGKVINGAPPGGDYVLAGQVGVNYTSPGYVGDVQYPAEQPAPASSNTGSTPTGSPSGTPAIPAGGTGASPSTPVPSSTTTPVQEPTPGSNEPDAVGSAQGEPVEVAPEKTFKFPPLRFALPGLGLITVGMLVLIFHRHMRNILISFLHGGTLRR